MYKTPPFPHQDQQPIGVLLVNLGTPDSPSVKDVRRYLAEFLSDPRVVEVPRLLWMLILHGVILRIRPARSAKAYQSVWAEDGSPLLAISRRQAAALQEQLDSSGSRYRVVLGMRYGNPSIASALDELRQANARRIVVLPLYPQYSASTVGSVFDAVTATLQHWRWIPEMRFINQYTDHPLYIEALADSVKQHWQAHGKAEKLVLSFHGIPQKYACRGDPYARHCRLTTAALVNKLGLGPDDWVQSYQSRVGAEPWLKPYTDHTMMRLAGEGVKSIQVICPGFSSDCLETIEEIDQENREYFMEHGGESFSYIPALNDSAAHIHLMRELVLQHSQGWDER